MSCAQPNARTYPSGTNARSSLLGGERPDKHLFGWSEWAWLGDRRGASAVEFALIAPILMLFVFGIVCFGGVLATTHAVQQLAGEAARASVAGLSEAERASLARSSVSANAASYALIDPARLAVEARSSAADPTTFEVVVRYDASAQFMYTLNGLIPLPSSTVQRRAAIKRGGY